MRILSASSCDRQKKRQCQYFSEGMSLSFDLETCEQHERKGVHGHWNIQEAAATAVYFRHHSLNVLFEMSSGSSGVSDFM